MGKYPITSYVLDAICQQGLFVTKYRASAVVVVTVAESHYPQRSLPARLRKGGLHAGPRDWAGHRANVT